MTRAKPAGDDRMLDLLCDRALDGLSAEEMGELEALLGDDELEAAEAEIERAAAALDLAQAGGRHEALPAALRERVLADAAAHFAKAPQPEAPKVEAPRPAPVIDLAARRREQIAWFAAAAGFALALFAFTQRPSSQATGPGGPEGTPVNAVKPPPCPTAAPEPPRAPSPSEAREKLIADGADVVRIDWSATKDPAGAGASGDVVWSNQKQIGYMRFHGLAVNDPAKSQFQLWIFDRDRDDRYPVDGGVFDVDPATGDVVVPIRAKVRVNRPALFAITVEPPGGVVVSKREHIVLTASVNG
jgi:hypothetical protein